MMGYLLVTEQGRMIAVDGGTEGDTRAFVELVQHFGGYIDLWILTHPHSDHVGVFWSLMDTPVGHCGYPVRILTPGDLFIQDQVEIEILRVADARCRKDYINNLSVVFKVTEKFKENAKRRIPGETEKQSPFTMIFLGDLGWTQGDRLLECCSDRPGILRADAVQMAHHGQWGVEENVYQAIGPHRNPAHQKELLAHAGLALDKYTKGGRAWIRSLENPGDPGMDGTSGGMSCDQSGEPYHL